MTTSTICAYLSNISSLITEIDFGINDCPVKPDPQTHRKVSLLIRESYSPLIHTEKALDMIKKEHLHEERGSFLQYDGVYAVLEELQKLKDEAMSMKSSGDLNSFLFSKEEANTKMQSIFSKMIVLASSSQLGPYRPHDYRLRPCSYATVFSQIIELISYIENNKSIPDENPDRDDCPVTLFKSKLHEVREHVEKAMKCENIMDF